MEKEITRKVESAANQLRDVSEIRSVTREGQSIVTITFEKNAPVEFRGVELREYQNILEQDLPPNIRPASITRSVPQELEDQQTFMVYTLSGDMESRSLLEYANKSIKAKLLGIEGLSGITLRGVEPPALMVEFDRLELEKYNLSPNVLMSQIRTGLSWRSSGFTEFGESRYSMTLPPKYQNETEIAKMRISLPGTNRQLLLDDIARVRVTDTPPTSIRRVNGSPALSIEFEKESGADAISLAEMVITEMDRIEQILPTGMDLRLQLDSTERLREQFDELAMQAVISGVLVFIVVLLFIRRLRAPFVIMGSVLFSVLMSISLLYFFEYTLNIITLAGLTIALGMLIDNAVVVFEQINPGLPENKADRIEHVRKELPKSLVPVLGSTFTTVGIFLPLLFAMEELRLFLLPLAIALTMTLVSSVIIAFTWIPYSLIWLSPVSKKKKKKQRKTRWNFQRSMLWLLIWRSRLRWVFLLILIAAIGIPVFLIEEPAWDEETNWPEFTQLYFDNRDDIDTWIGGLTYRFVNDTYFGSPWRRNSGEYVNVTIRGPQGTPLSELDKIVKSYETIVKPYEHAFSYYEARLSEQTGTATIRFEVDPDYLYDPAPYYFYGEAMYLGARTGNVGTSVQGLNIPGVSTGFGGSSSSYNIRLTGYSYNELYDLAREIERRLVRNRRVRNVDVNSGYYWGRDDFYQYFLQLDEEKMVARGLDRRELLSALSIDINPKNTFGRVEFKGQDMYLMGVSEAEEFYEEDLMEKIRKSGNLGFDLAELGTIEKQKAMNEIRRNNQSYERNISLDFLGNYRMGNEFIEATLKEVPVPVGAKINFGGSFFNFNEDENAKNLWLIALLSILSVWMIVSALLESWSGPMFVILAIPFCGIGIMLGTMFNDLAFDRGAIAGSLLSIGVVVNNAILLIHQKQLEQAEGIIGIRGWYYIFQKKLRTILITTTTTVFGLLPMLVFGSNEFWEALAVVVVWGLLFSTVLIILFSGIWDYKKVGFGSNQTTEH